LKRWMAVLALMTCLGAALAACGVPKQQPEAAQATRAAAGGQHTFGAGCPRGPVLPAGEAVAIDYVDFVRFDSRSYDRAGEPITARQLGRAVTRVRCSLIAEQDQRRGGPPIVNGTASFLPADGVQPAYAEAQFVVQVAVRQVFPNCPRYIHKLKRVEASDFVPRAGVATPVPAWKRMDWACDVLPAGDPAGKPDAS